MFELFTAHITKLCIKTIDFRKKAAILSIFKILKKSYVGTSTI